MRLYRPSCPPLWAAKERPHTRYPSQPYSAVEAPQGTTDDDRDALRAEVYMRQMIRAGKNWGMKSD